MSGNPPGVSRGYGPFQQGPDPAAPATSGPGQGEAAAHHPGAAPDQHATDPDRTMVVPPQQSGQSGQEGQGPTYTTPPYAPTSGAGYDQYGLGPSSGAPLFGAPDPTPVSSTPSSTPPLFDADSERFGFDVSPRGGPRIEPSPPPQRKNLILSAAAGLAAGLLIFGLAGFFIGRGTAGTAAPETPAPQPTASAAPSLPVYEQSQVDLNQAKLTGALTPLAQGWMPYLSNCEKNGETGGPALNKGEKTRVRCRLDGMSMLFVEYASVTDRDKARVKTLSQNVDARTLTPGVGPAGDKTTPSGRTSGSYVEYAYSIEENKSRKTVAGLWWDDTKTPVAAYVLAFWKTGVGEDWAPMRDLWSRNA